MDSIKELLQTVHQLRAPNGCAWDRAQTHQSLRPYLIEEAYEVLDVLDQVDSVESLKKETIRLPLIEELGDLLMQVVLHAEMASESGAFSFQDVARALNDKLIRRHPHVFGDTQASTEKSAFESWEKMKAKEKANIPHASIFDGLPRQLPALQRSTRMIEKASKVGFKWKDLSGPIEKIDEEVAELKEAIRIFQDASAKHANDLPNTKTRVSQELGDVLFSLCNLADYIGIFPEDSLRGTLQRFESRFRHVEKRLKEKSKTPEQSTLEEMDIYWNEAKASEKNP